MEITADRRENRVWKMGNGSISRPDTREITGLKNGCFNGYAGPFACVNFGKMTTEPILIKNASDSPLLNPKDTDRFLLDFGQSVFHSPLTVPPGFRKLADHTVSSEKTILHAELHDHYAVTNGESTVRTFSARVPVEQSCELTIKITLWVNDRVPEAACGRLLQQFIQGELEENTRDEDRSFFVAPSFVLTKTGPLVEHADQAIAQLNGYSDLAESENQGTKNEPRHEKGFRTVFLKREAGQHLPVRQDTAPQRTYWLPELNPTYILPSRLLHSPE